MTSGNTITEENYEEGVIAGIYKGCSLKKFKTFHAVRSFPFDYLHDFLEGAAPEDLKGVIDILLKEDSSRMKRIIAACQTSVLCILNETTNHFPLRKIQ